MLVKKLIIGLFSISSCFAFAGWDETGRSIDGIAYVDVATIQRNGAVARIATLMDFYKSSSTNGNKTYRSVKSVMDYDCQKMQMSTSQITAYSNQMSSGEIIFNYSYAAKWNSFSSDGSDIIHYKIACGIRVKK